jgi:cation diffusion facilitator family transporter
MADRPEGESTFAVIAAVIGNLVIAVIKFIAAAMTGSSAMIAEGIHSLVDTGNGVLVLFGMKQSERAADSEHPFGHGKELYFWTLIVAISIFGIGGGMSVYEGISHILRPSPLENPAAAYVVLAIAFVVEGTSFLIAMRQFNRVRGDEGPLSFIHHAKDPSLFTVVFEDSAAMLGLLVAFLGVFLGHWLVNPYFDGAASVIIGLILMVVAFGLASESKGLLVGEGVEPAVLDHMREIVGDDPAVRGVGAILTMYLGPHDLLVNLDVQFSEGMRAEEVDEAVDRIESALKGAYHEVNRVYIETASLRDVVRGVAAQQARSAGS